MNTLIGKITRNENITDILFLSVSTFGTKILGMIFLIILARLLTVTDYGDFKYLLSISLLLSVGFAGIPVSITKLVSNTEDSNDKNRVVVQGIIYGGALFLIITLGIILFRQSSVLLILLLLSVYIDSTYFGIIRGLIDTKRLTFFRLIQGVSKTGFVFLLPLYVYSGIKVAVYATLFAVIVSVFTLEIPRLRILCKNNSIFQSTFRKNYFKEIMKYAIPATISTVSYNIMFSIDTILLKSIIGSESVGYYNVGLTFSYVITIIPTAVSTLIMPKISKNGNMITNDIFIKINKAIFFTSIISLVLIALFYVLKEFMVVTVFGVKYLQASILVALLPFSQMFISLFRIYANLWTGVGKPKRGMYIISTAMVVNILLNIMLIPEYGIQGAAYATILSSLYACITIALPLYIDKERLIT